MPAQEKAKHTPGPWKVSAHGYDSPYLSKAYVEDEHGGPICGLWEGDGPNARLIAAAPDLYESLLEIVTEWGSPNTPKWHRAKAALARAEGR
jgi:hypothetical protein